ncbi:MAG: IS21 family transposase [Ktedonobacteraceae bacterium]
MKKTGHGSWHSWNETRRGLGTTLFALLCERHPGRYQPIQVRTLQRHIAQWKALHGPEQDVIFEQRHRPGERGQSDFTHMEDLGVTIAGAPFPHLAYHFVLTYSNVEAITVCFSESFEALAEGLERCLWQVGGVPEQHRTDHLTAAVRQLDKGEREDWTERYKALMTHYDMQPTWNNTGIAHENGDVEQSHYRFKEAVDQALRVRGSRDFVDRRAYEAFLQNLVAKRNQSRSARLAQERETLRPEPSAKLALCKEVRTTVSRFSPGPACWATPTRCRPDSLVAVCSCGCVQRPWRGMWARCARLPYHARLQQTAAPHRLSPSHLVVGAQAWCLCCLPLPR